MDVVSWSTDAVNERERFSYWREMICRSLFNITPEALTEDFSARMTARSSGQLRFVLSESTAYQFVRGPRDISSAPADHYSIYLQLSGKTVISQGDESNVFGANEIAISDGREPFSYLLPEGGRRVMAVVPRALVNRRAPWLSQGPLHKIASNSPFMSLARRHLLHLANQDLSENATSLLTENLCNLLALASGTDVTVNRMHPEVQIEAIVIFCRQNLHDSELSPQLVASHFRISVRTLHLRFEKFGQTFGQWLLENRLEAIHQTLRDPYQRSCNISDIAYRWGFNDLSYFNRTFRAHFGLTPSAVREGLNRKKPN